VVVAKGSKGHEETDDLKDLEARLVAKRAPFPAYLMKHFDAFARVIARVGPDWDEIADWAFENGHAGKEPISPDAARKAYEREKARRDKLAAKAKAEPPTREQPARTPNPVRIIEPDPPKPQPTSEPDDIAASLDQGRAWHPTRKR
jgi:hypothetical protein